MSFGGCIWVGIGCLVAMCTLVPISGNINCDVGPVDRIHGSGTHGADALVGGMQSIKNGFTVGSQSIGP